MAGLNKTLNEYAEELRDTYDQTPKAVFAAIAYSLALMLSEDDFNAARERIAAEWKVLHEQGIIPQKPVLTAKKGSKHKGIEICESCGKPESEHWRHEIVRYQDYDGTVKETGSSERTPCIESITETLAFHESSPNLFER